MSSLPREIWQMVLVNFNLQENIAFCTLSKEIRKETNHKGFLLFEINECQKIRKDVTSMTVYKLFVIAHYLQYDIAAGYLANLFMRKLSITPYYNLYFDHNAIVKRHCLYIVSKYEKEKCLKYIARDFRSAMDSKRNAYGKRNAYSVVMTETTDVLVVNDDVQAYSRMFSPLSINSLSYKIIESLRYASFGISNLLCNDAYYSGQMIPPSFSANIIQTVNLKLDSSEKTRIDLILRQDDWKNNNTIEEISVHVNSKGKRKKINSFFDDFQPNPSRIQAFIDKIHESSEPRKGLHYKQIYSIAARKYYIPSKECKGKKEDLCRRIIEEIKSRIHVDKDKFNFYD